MRHHITDECMAKLKFPLGRIVATKGALDVIARDKLHAMELLARHVSGDWGDLGDEDKQANEAAVAKGMRILSAYGKDPDTRLWVITEADRSVTTILTPNEY